jgi:translation initiation factor IF-2
MTSKVRVYELAKETGLGIDEVVRRLQQLGVDAKGNLSAISEGDAARLRSSLGGSEPARKVGGTIRVYELAKETGLENDELVRRLRLLGVDVKSHLSTISSDNAARVRDPLAGSEPERVVAAVGSEPARAPAERAPSTEAIVAPAPTEEVEGPPPRPGRQAATPHARMLARRRRFAAALVVVGLVLVATFVGLAGDRSDQPSELLAGSEPDAATSSSADGEVEPDPDASPGTDGVVEPDPDASPGTADEVEPDPDAGPGTDDETDPELSPGSDSDDGADAAMSPEAGDEDDSDPAQALGAEAEVEGAGADEGRGGGSGDGSGAAADPPLDSLPATGVDAWAIILLGIGLMAAGAHLVRARATMR